MLNRTATVALNTFTNYIRFGFSIGVWFLLTPFIINKVGDNDFGLWSLTFSIIGFFSLADFGFGTGVVKYVAECKGSNDIDRRNRMVSTIAVVYIIIAIASFALVIILSFYYNRIFSIPEQGHDKALALLWIISVRSVLLGLPLGIYRGVLFGEQKIYMINAAQTIGTVLYGLLTFWTLERGYGIVALAWINLFVMVIEHIFYICISYKYVKGLSISWSLAEKKYFREAASFSIYTFIVSVSALVLLRTDPIIIKFFLPLSAVAVYAVALKIAENAHFLVKQFVNNLTPLVAELQGQGDEQKIRFILVNCTKFALVPAVMITVAAIFLPKKPFFSG